MAEIKVSQLPEASQINDNDLIMIVQGGTNKKITKENCQFASGDEVSIGTTEPTDEEKIWINPNDVPTGQGSYISNVYSDSTEKGFSCHYSNEHYGGVVLFSGNTSGNVQLSDNASNYSYIEVYGQKSGCYGYVKIYSPNGKQFGLAVHNAYESNNIQQIFGRYTISGTTITKDFEVYMNNNGTPANSNDIKIEKVIGYK